MRLRRYRDLPLFAKFLLPFLALVVVLGALGTFLVVRDLSARAEAELDEALTRSSLDARSLLRDRELSLVEATSFSANLAGLAEALARSDQAEAIRLVRSVIALKPDLDLLVVARPDGEPFVAFLPRQSGAEPVPLDQSFAEHSLVQSALADPQGAKFAGILPFGDAHHLAVAGAVCSGAEGCESRGVVVVGHDVEHLASSLRSEQVSSDGVALFDEEGQLLASVGPAPDEAPSRPEADVLRRIISVDGVETAAVYADWTVRGERLGSVAVATPTGSVFSGVRGAGLRLALLVLAAMAGIVLLGAFLSRLTTSRMKELLETNRAIGRGELSARAPVMGDDELGELARGVNQMAEELEASRETLELRVRQRTEEVERLLRERNEIFASLSHELRTPLAVILRRAEMVLDPTVRKGKKWNDETGRTIRDSAEQLLSLVNDILELARAERGTIDVHFEDLDVREVLGELRPTIDGLARASDLRLVVDLPPDGAPVRADRRRLREVMLNLVDNAVKYTPAGGEVRVEVSAGEDRVRVAVIDSGVGIPEEVGDRIFEPFYRVRGTRTQRGQASTGLGLALTKRLVEIQGGSITFTSEVDEGTMFVVTLPARAERQEPASREGGPSGSSASPPPKRST